MKKVLSLILSMTMLFSITMGLTITASAIGNYGVNIDSSSYTSNDNPFTRKGYWGQCTWYCWGRAKEHGISLWWGSDTYGNAKDWYDNASAYYSCDQTPSANSILVSPDGWTSDGVRVGHVMFVEKVENGYAYTTEANYWGNGASIISWNGQTGRYHEDVINLSNNCRSDGSSISITGYIHLKCTNHTWDGGTITKEATCKKDGTKKYTCTVCGETKTEIIPKSDKYHKYKVVTTVKATMQADGKLGKECTICKKKTKSTIYHPKTIKLEKTVYTYNEKTHKPKVIIKDTKGNEIPSKYYTVSYKNNKNVGASTATVKLKTRYSGSKKLTFGVRPKGTSVSKLTAGVKAFTVKWKKQATQTTGYQIQYSTSSKFTKKTTKTITIKKNNKTSKKITSLKANKKYYVRIRTYKTVNKTKNYSAWSKVKSIKVNGVESYKKTIDKYKDGKAASDTPMGYYTSAYYSYVNLKTPYGKQKALVITTLNGAYNPYSIIYIRNNKGKVIEYFSHSGDIKKYSKDNSDILMYGYYGSGMGSYYFLKYDKKAKEYVETGTYSHEMDTRESIEKKVNELTENYIQNSAQYVEIYNEW